MLNWHKSFDVSALHSSNTSQAVPNSDPRSHLLRSINGALTNPPTRVPEEFFGVRSSDAEVFERSVLVNVPNAVRIGRRVHAIEEPVDVRGWESSL